MTDSEREQAIHRAGQAMEVAYHLFLRFGRQEDLDRAYSHLQQMKELAKGRNQHKEQT